MKVQILFDKHGRTEPTFCAHYDWPGPVIVTCCAALGACYHPCSTLTGSLLTPGAGSQATLAHVLLNVSLSSHRCYSHPTSDSDDGFSTANHQTSE